MVDRQTLHHDFFAVIVTLYEVFARHVVLAGNLGRVVLDVVAATRSGVHAAAGHTFDNFGVGHGDFEHEVNRHAGVLQSLSLRDGAREAVEKKAVLAVVGKQTFLDKPDDDVIAHEAALIHDHLGGFAEFGTGLDGGAKHVARRDLRNAEVFFDVVGLGAFTGAGGSDQDQTHEKSPINST